MTDILNRYQVKMQKLGFSVNEVKVYLTLIRLGSSKAGAISKYSNLDRSSTYNALKLLLQKGLCSYVIIGKIKWFQSTEPENILQYLTNKTNLAKEFIPELSNIHKQSKLKENVRLYKGIKGIKSVFEDILKNAKENLIFGSEGQLSERMPLFAKQFTKKLEKRGTKTKSIIRTNREKKRKKNKRTIPSTTESSVVTNIYSNKIAIIIWSDTPEAILIENKNAAEAYKDYFNFMWKYAERR